MADTPASILFYCGRNAIRSPMAQALARHMLGKRAYVASAGVQPGERDPFVDAVLAEQGLDHGTRHPQALEDLEDDNFDLVITLSPEAHHRALELTRTLAVEVEYWPTADPSLARGSREQIMDAYRATLLALRDRIEARFSAMPGAQPQPETQSKPGSQV